VVQYGIVFFGQKLFTILMMIFTAGWLVVIVGSGCTIIELMVTYSDPLCTQTIAMCGQCLLTNLVWLPSSVSLLGQNPYNADQCLLECSA